MTRTIPGEPIAASFTPPPASPLHTSPVPAGAAPSWAPSAQGPLVPRFAELSSAMPVTPAPPPRAPRKRWGRALLGVALVVLLAGGVGGVYALGAFEDGNASPEGPVEPPVTATPTSLRPSPPPPASLSALSGEWWTETGVTYEGVVVGDTVELRVHDAAQLPGQGYATGEAAFVLRPTEGDPQGYLVEARVRPPPPRGFVYDHTRAVASCVASFSHAGGKALKAVHAIDKLVVQTVKIDPAPSAFLHEGARVVGCAGLAAAHAVQTETVLGRTPVASPTAHWPAPHPDAGVHAGPLDAGAHDAGVHDPGAHDAGAGHLGSQCESDAQCPTGNCFAHRCLPAGKGYGGPCSSDWQCQSHHCISSMCR
jgi:hypothetical protein